MPLALTADARAAGEPPPCGSNARAAWRDPGSPQPTAREQTRREQL
jgi:hypothetical protein